MALKKIGTESRSELDKNGWEIPDQTPVSVPAGFKRPETLAEQVRRLVHHSISKTAEEQGLETFEDSEDFDLPDDPDDPTTPYEEFFDPLLGRGITLQEFRDNYETYKTRFLKADQAAYDAMRLSDALRRPHNPERGGEGGDTPPSSAHEPQTPPKGSKPLV